MFQPTHLRALRSRRIVSILGVACLGLVLLSGCASAGQFVWYKDLPKTDWDARSGDYVIGVGDVVNIRVYEQEGLSGTVKVRRDGRVGLPLVGEIMAAGKAPLALSHELEARLKEFIVSPRVTANIETSQPVVVSALGELKTTGTITLEAPSELVQALAQAGGPAEFADKTRIFVLRQFPASQRIRFTYDAIVRNEAGAATFPLRTGDVIIVE